MASILARYAIRYGISPCNMDVVESGGLEKEEEREGETNSYKAAGRLALCPAQPAAVNAQ